MKKLFALLCMTIIFISSCSTSEIPKPPEYCIKPTEFTVETASSTEFPLSENSSFEVRYIDVGQADAALILCDGQSMLIDGGNAADSSLIVAYLRKLNIDYLNYIVCSHAHEDHVGGISGALSAFAVGTVYAPETAVKSDAYSNFVKKVDEQKLQHYQSWQ